MVTVAVFSGILIEAVKPPPSDVITGGLLQLLIAVVTDDVALEAVHPLPLV